MVQFAQADSASAKPAKAIFVLIDGIPADQIEAIATPHIDSIAQRGGYRRAFVGGEIGGVTESPTISAVGYMSLLTGTWANKHNVWGNKVEAPDYRYWDIFRIAKHVNPKLRTALFSTWEDNRTKLIGDGLEQAGGAKIDYAFDGFEHDTVRFPHDEKHSHIDSIDQLVTEQAADYVVEHGPDLSWVYLEYSDTIAHGYGDSPQFVQGVKTADQRVGEIWQAVQKRQQSHNEDWLIVVTTDHGRDAETGKSHGKQSERERTIWLATNSKQLNDHFDGNLAIVDIMPSILQHLNISVPAEVAAELEGQSFIGASK